MVHGYRNIKKDLSKGDTDAVVILDLTLFIVWVIRTWHLVAELKALWHLVAELKTLWHLVAEDDSHVEQC